METKNCQNCKKDFNIEAEDFLFYEKMKVPAPTWCSECRFMRRLTFLNWNTLYKRKCDLCKKDIISVHNKDKNLKVYCPSCWWGDTWDGTEYEMDYDPEKGIIKQMIELKNKTPFMGLESMHLTLVNTPYCNAAAYQKDCFMMFHADYGERCAYVTFSAHTIDCVDCYRINNSEKCYECVGVNKCFGCIFSEELDSCADCLFCRACSGCTNCFGCINLRNKSYCIFNVQYSKEEYKKRISEFRLNTRSGIKNALNLSLDFWKDKPRRSSIGNSLNVNTTGDMVYESKNTKNGYMITSAEDSKFVQFVTLASTKDCYDYTIWGAGAERIYECLTTGEGSYNNKFSAQCWPAAIDNEYCLYVIQSKSCFGCVNLKRKEYCILNKQYTKEEYIRLREKIIEDMNLDPYVDSIGRTFPYGEFLTSDLSPYAYNESRAIDFYPIDKSEISQNGFVWYEGEDQKYTITITFDSIPDEIKEAEIDLSKQTFECLKCNGGFRLNDTELMVIKKMNLPVPFSYWKCRNKRRFGRVNGPQLYDRDCDKCGDSIKTSYAINMPEIVYCESCYQNEVQ